MGWLRALRWPTYRRVWLVATMLQFGYWFASIAFQWLVARDTDSDPLSLSLLYFFMLIPMLIFSLPAGVLADTRDRRSNILLSQLGVVLVSAVTAGLVLLDRAPFGVLIACGFAAGMVQAGAVPSAVALVANSVPVEDLRSAIVVQSAGMNLARILGPAIAGLIILSLGAVESVFMYGGMAALTLLALRGLKPLPRTETGIARPSVMARIGAGLRHVREHPPAGTALLVVAATSLFGLSYIAQMPALAARVSPDPSVFLLLTTLAAIGSGFGLLVVVFRPNSAPTVTPAAMLLALQGVVVVALGFTTVLWLAVALVTIGGAMMFAIMTSCNTVIQAVVDDDHRGRVMSLYVMCWGGLMPVGGLLLGVVWHFAGPQVALGSCGLAALLVAGAVLRPGLAQERPDAGTLRDHPA